MKNASIIFTRTRAGLDTRVWLTMLLVLFVAALFLSFKMATHITCTEYEIKPVATNAGKANHFYTGETILFTAAVPAKSNLVWDFGDGTPTAAGNNIKHGFLHDGNYMVTAMLNTTCMQSLPVNIEEFKSKVPVPTVPTELTNVISGTDAPHVGESVKYFSTVPSQSYEWSVLNEPEYPTYTDSVAGYKFVTPGNQIIVLKINGDDKKVYTKNITVLPPVQRRQSSTAASAHTVPSVLVPLPPKVTSFAPISGSTGTEVFIFGSNFTDASAVSFGETPAASFMVLSPTSISAKVGAGASGNVTVTTKNGKGLFPGFTYNAPASATSATSTKPKTMMIADEEFKHMFDEVCAGKMDASGFNAYLCKGDQTKVLANNDWKSLADFCTMLKAKKKVLLGLERKNYSIKTVKVTRDPANQNCVTLLTVEYK